MAERVLTVKIIGNSSSLERSFKRSSVGAAQFDRNLGRATRGALAGSGVFRGLGRSIAFASGGFLAFASVGQFLRKSVDAAKDALVTQKQLAAQFRASGKDARDFQKQIDATGNRLSLLSGFQNDELKAAFTTIFRSSGDVTKSLRDEATAADLARAKRLGLAQAALIVAKTEAGNTTLLRRQGIQIAKNATSEQALAKLRKVVAGQGRAGTTEQERFGAVLHNTEEIIGAGLLPTLNKYLAQGATWLTQMNQSGRLQHDVNETVKTAGDVFGGLKDVVTPLVAVFKGLGGAVGGTKKEVELLAGAFVILKARAKLTGLGLIGGEIAGIGSKSILASGEVATLTSRLGLLAKIGAAGIVLNFIPKAKASSNPNAPSRNPVAQFFAGLPFVGGAFSQANAAADAIDKKLGLLPGPPGAPSLKGLNPATRGLGPSTHGNPFGELRFGDPTTASRRLLSQTFAQAKALNPQLTRKAFDLGQEVARAFINGTTTAPKAGKKPLGGLSLGGRFNIAELKLAQAELTKQTGDDRLQLQIESSITREQIKGAKTLKDKTALTQKLVGIMGQLKGLTKAVSDSFTLPERFSVDAAKAATTATQKDDLDAARETKVLVSKLISSGKLRGQALEQAYGDLASANDQLLAAQKEAAAKTLARISGKQFRALGLDASGAALTPNTKSLRKDLGKFSDAVSGTFLDTSKTQSVLSKIRRVLGGGLGALSKDVRSTIKQMLDDLDQQLKGHSGGPETKFQKANTAKLLAGLGLDPAEVRAVRARLSQLGPGGTVPRSSPGSPAFAGAGTQPPFTANLILDGRVAATVVSRHQDKQRRRNPGQRRGPHAGQ